MTIEQALELLENDYVENDIRALTAKDRLTFWSQLKEFSRPKMQRAVTLPELDDITEIIILYDCD